MDTLAQVAAIEHVDVLIVGAGLSGIGAAWHLQKECPGKEFLCAPVFDALRTPIDNCRCSECKFMKMNTLEKLRDCMKNLAPQIELPAEIIRRARLPIERMLEISAMPLENAG